MNFRLQPPFGFHKVEEIRPHPLLGEIICYGDFIETGVVGKPISVFEQERWRAAEWREFNRSRFLETSDPLYAWSAIHDSLSTDLPIPEFAARYLLTTAGSILHLVQSPPKEGHIAPAVSQAVGLQATGARNPFEAHNRPGHEFALASEVLHYKLRHDHYAWDAVFEDVAAAHTCERCAGVSPGLVKRCWYAHRAAWGWDRASK